MTRPWQRRHRRSGVTAPIVRSFVAAAVVAAGALPIGDAAADPIDDQRRRVTEITDQLAALEQRSDILAEDHVVALDELRGVEAEVVEAQAQVDAKATEVAAMRDQLAEVAVRTYMDAAGGSGLSPLLTNSSRVTEVLERQTLSKVALSTGDATIDEFDEAIDDLNDQRAALQDAEQQAEAQAAAVADAKQANEDSKARYQQARGQAEDELGNLIREEEERRARESYEQAQRAAEQAAAEQAAAAEAAQARAQAQTPPARTPAASPTTPPPAAPRDTDNTQSPAPAVVPPAQALAPSPARDEPAPADPPPAPPPASSRVDIAINAAKTQLGVPWVFAKAEPGVGFDCSGLTKWAWAQAGVALPHQSRAQAALLPEVSAAQAQPGDLLFYYSPISHVGIYLGGGQLIHSPNSGTAVKIANVNWNNVTRVGRPG